MNICPSTVRLRHTCMPLFDDFFVVKLQKIFRPVNLVEYFSVSKVFGILSATPDYKLQCVVCAFYNIVLVFNVFTIILLFFMCTFFTRLAVRKYFESSPTFIDPPLKSPLYFKASLTFLHFRTPLHNVRQWLQNFTGRPALEGLTYHFPPFIPSLFSGKSGPWSLDPEGLLHTIRGRGRGWLHPRISLFLIHIWSYFFLFLV